MYELREETVADLREHAEIPSIFESESIYEVRELSGSIDLIERALPAVLRKNYDSSEDPRTWSKPLASVPSVRISAFLQSQRVGAVIVAVGKPGIVLWENDSNAAILWDLRVAPTHRRQSIATSLLQAASSWAQHRGCVTLEVETQNTNPGACKFYAHNGFSLWSAKSGAYSDVPDDVRLIWRARLDG